MTLLAADADAREADQAELDHRAIILDEARVRRAAAGRKLGLHRGDVTDRRGERRDAPEERGTRRQLDRP